MFIILNWERLILINQHINGDAYDHFNIRYNIVDHGLGGAPVANSFQFGWKNDKSSTIYTLPSANGYESEGVWYENTYNLSACTQWSGNKITYLEYDFMDVSGEEDIKIDWIVVSGNNHPHPYRWNPPSFLGANGWNTSY